MHSPTTTSGPTPEPAQVMRQLARARIGVAVAQPLVLEHHRIRVRCARHLCREQLRQGHADVELYGKRVEILQQAVPTLKASRCFDFREATVLQA